MKKTVCFIRFAPTSPNMGKIIDPWWYHQKNFNVLYWNLSQIFFSKIQINKYKVHKNYYFKGPNEKIFKNKLQLIDEFKKLSRDTIIIYFNRNPFKITNFEDKWIIFELKKFKNIGLMQFDTRPKGENKYSKLKDIYLILKNRISSYKLNPKFYIGCGSIGKYWACKIYPNSKFISTPSPLINWKTKNNLSKDNYIVFVDENFILQPDSEMYNEIYCKDVDNYHKRMNSLFKFLENKLEKKIVIAASGKYIYDKNPFSDRKIIYNNTLELISNSSLTIGHCSLALYQVIKENTPLLLIRDESFTNRQIIENKYTAKIFNSEHLDSKNRSWKKIESLIYRKDSLNNAILTKFFNMKDDNLGNKDYRLIIEKYLNSL